MSRLAALRQRVRNYIGDNLGHRRCPVTRVTCWKEKLVFVPYTYDYDGKPMQSVGVRKAAFKTHTPKEIVKIVLSNRYRKHYTFEERIYSKRSCMGVFMDTERGVVYSIPSRSSLAVSALSIPPVQTVVRRRSLTVQGMPPPPPLSAPQ